MSLAQMKQERQVQGFCFCYLQNVVIFIYSSSQSHATIFLMNKTKLAKQQIK